MPQKSFLKCAALLTLALAHTGCFLFPSTQNRTSNQGAAYNAEAWKQAIGLVAADTIDTPTVDAIAACGCTPGFDQKYAYALIQRKGVLPEVLVPAVREAIRTNDKLKLLQQLAGPFSGVLQRLFLNDDALLDEVRSGVYELVQKSTGWKSLEKKPFRFSLFPPVTPSKADSEIIWSTQFETIEQAIRWNYFFASNSLWSGAIVNFENDHSLELAQVALIASEIQYIFGLTKSPSGQPYGGLTLSVENPKGDGVRDFDPRQSYTTPRYVSGRYRANLPVTLDAVEAAMNARESWTNHVDVFSLEEQARLWSASARMLERMRPSARTFTKPFYDATTGIFPTEVYSMPFLFLASIESLLTKQFINENTLTIKTLVAAPGAQPIADLTGKARAMAMTQLLEALTLWYEQLKTVGDINLSQDLKAQLIAAPKSLKRAMQFTTAELLNEAVRSVPGSSSQLIEVAFQGSPTITGDIAASAQVITTLARMSRLVMRSQFLEDRLTTLVNTFGTHTLQNLSNTPITERPAQLFWTLALYNEWEKHNPDPKTMPWFAQAHTDLKNVVSQWDAVR